MYRSILSQAQDGRTALILESTVFHPQGGGQPSDTGSIVFAGSDFKFSVQDARSKDGIVITKLSISTVMVSMLFGTFYDVCAFPPGSPLRSF